MDYGSKPADKGFLSNIDDFEVADIKLRDPVAAKYLRRLIGAEELINAGSRWCLWLVDAEPADLRTSAELRRRVEGV